MWDSNSPLQLLQSMPRKLTAENLEKLQLVIDADKYKNSLVSGFDLCGMYAPFCRGCRKTSIFPCAIAYVNMLQANGVDIEIDAKPMAAENPPVAPPVESAVAEEAPVTANTNAYANTYYEQPAPAPAYQYKAEEPVSETAAVADEPEKSEVFSQPQPVAEPVSQPAAYTVNTPVVKRKIRIAVARKKM